MSPAPLILLVDDEDISRYTVRKILQREGYRVIEANNGHAALDAARKLRPDLVLLDVVMPELDGYQVLKKIRNDPDLKNLFVVHLSAQVAPVERKMQGLRLGADGYLAQPIESAELVARVEAFLRHKATLDQLRASEERYRQLFEGNPQPMWIYDQESRRMLAVNDATLASLQAQRDSFLQRTADSLLQEIPESASPGASPRGARQFAFDESGLRIEFEIVEQAIVWNDSPARAVLAIDVTERNRAERERQERLNRFLRELNSLSVLSGADTRKPAAAPAEGFRARQADDFARLARAYMKLLEEELDRRVFRTEQPPTTTAVQLADELFTHGATGRDVIELHYAALKKLAPTPEAPRALGYMEVARFAILEILSHLLFRYRTVTRKVEELRQLSH